MTQTNFKNHRHSRGLEIKISVSAEGEKKTYEELLNKIAVAIDWEGYDHDNKIESYDTCQMTDTLFPFKKVLGTLEHSIQNMDSEDKRIYGSLKVQTNELRIKIKTEAKELMNS